MGETFVDVKISNKGQSFTDCFLVDTGATLSVAPAEKLRALGVPVLGNVPVELADGSVRSFPFGEVSFSFDGETFTSRILFGASPLLGVTALEIAGLMVDPVGKRLRKRNAILLKHYERTEIMPLREADITRTIAREYFAEFDQLVESDVLIVGCGPAGLVCGKELASAGLRVVIVEQFNHLGGGFWNGGYLMNKAAIAHPAQEILLNVGVPCKKISDTLYIVDPPHAISKLIGSALDAGVKVLNNTQVVDLVIRGNDSNLEGIVVNWHPLEVMGHDAAHIDPIALESKVVVDATGHDAITVALLAKRGLHTPVPGNGAMWVGCSEAKVLEKTGEVYPNLFVVGLSVAAVYGTPRMGPAFGAMLLSGKKGADQIKKKLQESVHGA